MMPTKSTIRETCLAIVDEYWNGDRDSLTVRSVRIGVEEKLGLDKGFLLQGEWKELSRGWIKGYVDELLLVENGQVETESEPVKVEPEEKPKPEPKTKLKKEEKSKTKTALKKATEVKKGTKRTSTENKSRPSKRRKKEESDISELSDVSADDLSAAKEPDDSESDFGGKSDSDAPKTKRGLKAKVKSKPQGKRQSKKLKVESDDEENNDGTDDSGAIKKAEASDSEESPRKVKSEPKRTSLAKRSKVESGSEESPRKIKPESKRSSSAKRAKVESDSEPDSKKSNLKHEENEQNPPRNSKPESTPTKPDNPDDDSKSNVETKPEESESEMSVLIDEEAPKPKAKGKRKHNNSESTKSADKAKSTSTSTKATPKEPTADETQLKTLQSQLLKCGVRKIWAFELKQYGDDSKAKIRHLQKMLKDVGMTGRFSNERARDIKEMRELQADLEAVKEGESKWGLESGKRKVKLRGSLRDDLGSDDDLSEGEEGEDGMKMRSRSVSEKPKGIGRDAAARAKADLAFLGDESDSD